MKTSFYAFTTKRKDGTEAQCIKCVLTSSTGTKFIGTATCGPRDTYDEAIGKEIALQRARLKIVNKNLKRVSDKDAALRGAIDSAESARKKNLVKAKRLGKEQHDLVKALTKLTNPD